MEISFKSLLLFICAMFLEMSVLWKGSRWNSKIVPSLITWNSIGTNPFEIFKGVDLALLVEPSLEDLEWNEPIFCLITERFSLKQGRALNDSANPNVKVFVVWNPCNTNCLIAQHYAPKNRASQLSCNDASRSNRAVSFGQKSESTHWSGQLSDCLGKSFFDSSAWFTHALINGKKALEVIKDPNGSGASFWRRFKNEGSHYWRRGKSSAASAANALIEAVRSIYVPTKKGDWFHDRRSIKW